MFDIEFIVTMLVMFMYSKFNVHACFAQKLLAGMHFFVNPVSSQLEKIARAPQYKRQKKAPEPVDVDFVRVETAIIMDKNRPMLLAGRRQRIVPWDSFMFVEQWDNLVFMLVTLSLAFGFSDSWSCVKAQQAHKSTYFAVLVGAGGTLYFLWSIVWFLGFRNPEVRTGVYFGIVSGILAYLSLTYLSGFIIDFRLDDAFADVSKRAGAALANITGDKAALATSPAVFRAALATAAGFCSFLMLLPGLRFSRVYHAALPEASTITKLLLHASFYSTMFVTACWIKPLTTDFLVAPLGNPNRAATAASWETLRLGIVLASVGVRLLSFRASIAAHLKQARTNVVNAYVQLTRVSPAGGATVEELMGAGRAETQKVFSVLCLVSTQLLAPIAFTLFMALLMKRGSGTTFGACAAGRGALGLGAPADGSSPRKMATMDHLLWGAVQDFLEVDSAAFTSIVTPAFQGGVASFIMWWTTLSWFCVTGFGMVYWEMYTVSLAKRQADAVAKAKKKAATPAAGAAAGSSKGGARQRVKREK